MRTIDNKVHELCEEIDYLKAKVVYWREKYEQEIEERNKESVDRMEEAKKGVRNALMFAFSVKDDTDGNLTITKEDRKTLAKNWK